MIKGVINSFHTFIQLQTVVDAEHAKVRDKNDICQNAEHKMNSPAICHQLLIAGPMIFFSRYLRPFSSGIQYLTRAQTGYKHRLSCAFLISMLLLT